MILAVKASFAYHKACPAHTLILVSQNHSFSTPVGKMPGYAAGNPPAPSAWIFRRMLSTSVAHRIWVLDCLQEKFLHPPLTQEPQVSMPHPNFFGFPTGDPVTKNPAPRTPRFPTDVDNIRRKINGPGLDFTKQKMRVYLISETAPGEGFSDGCCQHPSENGGSVGPVGQGFL